MDDIKTAFRKKAIKHHPDKHQGDKQQEEIFKKISEAYNILSDPKLKREYDTTAAYSSTSYHSHTKTRAQSRGGGFNFEDLDEEFWEEEVGPEHFGFRNGGAYEFWEDDLDDFQFHGFSRKKKKSRQRAERRPKTPDPTELEIAERLDLTLEQMFQGYKTNISFDRNVVCTSCNGQGVASKQAKKLCHHCGGSGVQIGYQGGSMFEEECFHCKGTGAIILNKHKCRTCDGVGLTQERKTVTIHVPPGTNDSEMLVFQGLGNSHTSGSVGELKVTLSMKPHKTFKRNGCDLLMNKQISLVEALSGFKFVAMMVDGNKCILKNDPNGKIVKPGEILMVPGQGMPRNKYKDTRGDLYVKMEIVYPNIPFLDADKLKYILNSDHRSTTNEYPHDFDKEDETVKNFSLIEVPFTTKIPDFHSGKQSQNDNKNSSNTKKSNNSNNNNNNTKSNSRNKRRYESYE